MVERLENSRQIEMRNAAHFLRYFLTGFVTYMISVTTNKSTERRRSAKSNHEIDCSLLPAIKKIEV